MLMKIYRTSDWDMTSEMKPCENAILLAEKPYIHESDGEESPFITCHEWAVEINNIEDLMHLVEECGCDVILKRDKSLEIYDDWRE